ncbi:polyprenyl synthetase family protein [Weissella kandleri]|uniref:polyprenyl synthetase family protein n=1 Tax=Weissella kandleri TaxID=1616 RepID=UPI00387EC8F2
MNFNQFTKEMRPQIEETLTKELATVASNPELQAALEYSTLAGGKRLRPLLTLAVLQSYHVDLQAYLKAVSAVELIHSYSLIHDDLPIMDDDDLRRGKPTTHRKFGAAVALLAGDALQPLAFEWLLSVGPLSSRQKLALAQNLAQAAGAAGMVGGQVEDWQMTGRTPQVAELDQIHQKKTGALIIYACQSGGIMVDASPDEMQALTRFGQAFGFAFQLKDDLHDWRQDQGEDKNAYPALIGFKATQERLKATVEQAQQAVADLEQVSRLDWELLATSLAYFEDVMES